MDGYVTRAQEEQAEAEAFAQSVMDKLNDLQDAAVKMFHAATFGEFTIPDGTDCAAFEARLVALTRDIAEMRQGYRPGERVA